jgi:hypothetical protein
MYSKFHQTNRPTDCVIKVVLLDIVPEIQIPYSSRRSTTSCYKEYYLLS